MELNTEFDLDKIVEMPNIAEAMEEQDLYTVGCHVWKGFEADKESRSAWEKRTEESMKLALQVAEAKSFPWPGASNVKFPLVSCASIYFISCT